MVISQPENNPSYYYRASVPSIALPDASRDTLCSMRRNYNIRVTHRNGAIKHIFYTNQIHGGIISRLFFIHFVAHACSSSGQLKYYFKSFCMKILSTCVYPSSIRLYFPPEYQQDRTLLRNQYY